MAIATFDCPHCGSLKMSFRSVGEYMHKRGDSLGKFTTFYICLKCENPIVIRYWPNTNTFSKIGTSPHHLEGDPKETGYNLESTETIKPLTDTFLQAYPNILNYYQQMMDNYKRNNWDATGTMGRKIVDVATKKLLPKGKLANRIDALVNQGEMHKELGKWAHEIRLDGNDASHEEEIDKPFDPQSAKEMVMFVEAFLIFHYQIPQIIEQRKLRASPPNKSN